MTKDDWPDVLNRKRDLYNTFIGELYKNSLIIIVYILLFLLLPEDLIVMPGEGTIDGERVDVTFHDHPLNCNPNSKWQTFFKDNEVLLQIDKDVR